MILIELKEYYKGRGGRSMCELRKWQEEKQWYRDLKVLGLEYRKMYNQFCIRHLSSMAYVFFP